MKGKDIQLLRLDQLSIKATIWKSQPQRSVLLYLHGGGLIFGNRHDLPNEYINKFIEKDITVIALDYLLAPESKLDHLLLTLKQSISELQTRYNFSQLNIMGRSAGAYLAYLLIRDGLKVNTFIDLYGYAKLTAPEFCIPAPYYTQFPMVLPLTAQQLVQSHLIITSDLSSRFPIYVSARQFGTWLSLFLPNVSQKDKYSLNDDELIQFPKTMLIHCINDPDVPFDIAQQTAKLIPQAALVSINKKEHDFDRNVTVESLAYYDQIIAFIVNN